MVCFVIYINVVVVVVFVVGGVVVPGGGGRDAGCSKHEGDEHRASREVHDVRVSGLILRMKVHGFGWHDGIAGHAICGELLNLAKGLPCSMLAPAGMSASVARFRDPTLRGDLITWVPLNQSPSELRADGACNELVELCASPSFSALRDILQVLLTRLNKQLRYDHRRAAEQLELPAKLMLAHYAAGSRCGVRDPNAHLQHTL